MSGANHQAVMAKLAALGCAVDRGQTPTPLDMGELVIQADGPDDLPGRVQGIPEIRRVNPSSDLTLLSG